MLAQQGGGMFKAYVADELYDREARRAVYPSVEIGTAHAHVGTELLHAVGGVREVRLDMGDNALQGICVLP